MDPNILQTLLHLIQSINDRCVEFRSSGNVLAESQEQNLMLERNLNSLFTYVSHTPLEDQPLKDYFNSIVMACLKTTSHVYSFLVEKLHPTARRFVFSAELLNTCEKSRDALRACNAMIERFLSVLMNPGLSDMRERITEFDRSITELDRSLNDLFDLLQTIFLEIHKNDIPTFVDNFFSSATWQNLLQLFPVLVLVQRWWEENKKYVIRLIHENEATRKKFNLDDQIRIAMEVFHEPRFYADTARGDCLYQISKVDEFYWYNDGYKAFILPILEYIEKRCINTEALVRDIHACFNEAVVITKNVWLYHEFHTDVKHLLQHYTSEDRMIFTYLDLKTKATKIEKSGYISGSYSWSKTQMTGKLKVKAFTNERQKREWLQVVLGISYH